MSVVAIPVFEGRVSSRLDCAEQFLLVTRENGRVCKREEIHLLECSPMEIVRFLLHEEVNLLICGGLTEMCERLLRDGGIQVIPWVQGDVEEILARFLQGKLPDNNTFKGKGHQYA